MVVVFATNIDKYKAKFPSDFEVVPRVGEFVQIEKLYQNQNLPFDKLQVVDVTYVSKDVVKVELHLSSLQARQDKELNLGVFK